MNEHTSPVTFLFSAVANDAPSSANDGASDDSQSRAQRDEQPEGPGREGQPRDDGHADQDAGPGQGDRPDDGGQDAPGEGVKPGDDGDVEPSPGDDPDNGEDCQPIIDCLPMIPLLPGLQPELECTSIWSCLGPIKVDLSIPAPGSDLVPTLAAEFQSGRQHRKEALRVRAEGFFVGPSPPAIQGGTRPVSALPQNRAAAF